MDTKKMAGIVIPMLIFTFGCSGNYGLISNQADNEDKVFFAELRENWRDYHIYYTMRSNRYATAIMFDPKDNGTKLAGDSWIKIEDEQDLNQRIYEIQALYEWVTVGIIKGPDNQIFGYAYPYYLCHNIPVKVVDEKTLYVSTLPPPSSTPP